MVASPRPLRSRKSAPPGMRSSSPCCRPSSVTPKSPSGVILLKPNKKPCKMSSPTRVPPSPVWPARRDRPVLSVRARAIGIKQTRDHRKTGSKLNVKDVLSEYCQGRKGVNVERLDRFNEQDDCWEEAVVQDMRSLPVPEVVAFRCDFTAAKSLKRRDRRMAQFLSLGHRTSDAARKFKVSAGRVSQLRRELAESWRRFVGDDDPPAAVAA